MSLVIDCSDCVHKTVCKYKDSDIYGTIYGKLIDLDGILADTPIVIKASCRHKHQIYSIRDINDYSKGDTCNK